MRSTARIDRAHKTEAAKAARRQDIQDAARRVFAERGFRGTTMADVAEEAGIALGTIYIYFKSKEDIFAALQRRFSDLVAAALSDGSGGDGLEDTVRNRIRDLFIMCGDNRDLIRLVVLNSDRNANRDEFVAAEEDRLKPLVDAFGRAAGQGFIRRADPRIMAKLIVGFVSIAVYRAFVIEDGLQSDRYRDECAAMIAAYLQPTEGPVPAAG